MVQTPLKLSHGQIQDFSIRFSGKLLLRNEIPLNDRVFMQLLSLAYFTALPSIIRKGFYYKCLRCGNQKRSLFANIPCQRCKKTHVYCRKCIEMGRILMCESLYYWSGIQPDWPKINTPCTWDGRLTKDQERAANRITNAVKRHETELLVWAVCGSGKTEMLFPGITEALQQGKRICIATPRADVVRELLPRLKRAFSGIHIQGLYGGSKDNDGSTQMMIATTHQMLRYKSAFDLLIIDEIDAFPYHADPSLSFATSRARKPKGTTIYLTATPRQKQRIQIIRKKLPHIFVPIRFHGHPLPVPTFKMCFSLRKNLLRSLPPPSFMTWLKTRANQERQIVLFVPTIPLAKEMQAKLAELVVKERIFPTTVTVQAVHAEDPDREEKVEQFRNKKIPLLITTTILERGVTFPSIDVAVLDAGHPVFDEAALVQIAGRAGRSPKDPTGEVFFFHEGKTEAMVQAVDSIISMNKRGGFL